MIISRRKFLGRSSVVGITAVLPLTAISASAESSANPLAWSAKSQPELSSVITNEAFTKNQNTGFQVMISALDIQTLKLVKVSKKNRSKAGESFEVVFLGPKDKEFQQGTYMAQHEKMGDFPIFLVPAGAKKEGAYYQAVFNRLYK